MIKTDKIAVVILNWNGRDMMRRFLPSVTEHSADEGLVIVADNGSTDGSLDMLSREFPSVVQLPLPKNYGFAEGYNRALAQIEAPYYLLLNSDVEVSPHWLRPLLDFMEHHPQAAACQPKLLAQTDKGMFEYAGAAGGYIDRYGYPFCRGRVFGTVEADQGQYDTNVPVLWATGAALLVRSEAWNEVGGLDGRFFAHMEEIDFCWRLNSRGKEVWCVTDSTVYHVGGATLPAGNPRKTFLNFRNNLLMLFKNLPESQLRPVMRIRFWLDALASLQFFLTGQWGSAAAVWKARRAFLAMRPDFEADREKNLRLSTLEGHSATGILPASLLWLYYAKGCKTFSRLRSIF